MTYGQYQCQILFTEASMVNLIIFMFDLQLQSGSEDFSGFHVKVNSCPQNSVALCGHLSELLLKLTCNHQL